MLRLRYRRKSVLEMMRSQIIVPTLLIQSLVWQSADSSLSHLGFQTPLIGSHGHLRRGAPGLGSALCCQTLPRVLNGRSLGSSVVFASMTTGGNGGVDQDGLDVPDLQSVKNVRDLASVKNSPIKPGR